MQFSHIEFPCCCQSRVSIPIMNCFLIGNVIRFSSYVKFSIVSMSPLELRRLEREQGCFNAYGAAELKQISSSPQCVWCAPGYSLYNSEPLGSICCTFAEKNMGNPLIYTVQGKNDGVTQSADKKSSLICALLHHASVFPKSCDGTSSVKWCLVMRRRYGVALKKWIESQLWCLKKRQR